MLSQNIKLNKDKVKKNLIGWSIMLPSLILFAFFIWIPLISNIQYSFYEIQGFNREFVGFQNYIDVFRDPKFMAAFTNTFKYVFYSIIIGFIVPIFLGLLLSGTTHFKGFFRVGIYFPCIISGMAVAIMWSFIFDSNQSSMLNSIIRYFGGKPFLWLDDKRWNIPLIVLTMTWRGAGGTVLIYLSAFQTVDTNYYEAARLDGASLFQRLRYITFPSIKNTILLLFILQVISVLQVFNEPLVMTNGGGPVNSSLSLMLLSYLYFTENSFGRSAAVGVILATLIIVLTLIYFYFVKKTSKEE